MCMYMYMYTHNIIWYRYCPRCKTHCEATKQMSVWKLPQILIIHLKRFSFNTGYYGRKIMKLVKFPLRWIQRAYSGHLSILWTFLEQHRPCCWLQHGVLICGGEFCAHLYCVGGSIDGAHNSNEMSRLKFQHTLYMYVYTVGGWSVINFDIYAWDNSSDWYL